MQACNVLNPFIPSSLPNCALHPPALGACCCRGGLRGRRMLRAAVTLQEFAAGRMPLRSQPCKQALPVPCPLLQPGRCHPQRFTAPPALTKLRPKASCVPAAPALRGHQGFVGSAVGAPAGAWWPPTWSDFAWEHCGVAAHPLAMCSAWQTSCWWPRGFLLHSLLPASSPP